jgi:hypothetical protein
MNPPRINRDVLNLGRERTKILDAVDGEELAHLMKSDLSITARNGFSDRFAGFDGDRLR